MWTKWNGVHLRDDNEASAKMFNKYQDGIQDSFGKSVHRIKKDCRKKIILIKECSVRKIYVGFQWFTNTQL